MIEILYKRYKEEKKKWEKAGKPIRSAQEIQRVYSICSECPLFQKNGGWIPGYDKCSECQCNLHSSNHFMNKIAWATTHCPLERPKWTADV